MTRHIGTIAITDIQTKPTATSIERTAETTTMGLKIDLQDIQRLINPEFKIQEVFPERFTHLCSRRD